MISIPRTLARDYRAMCRRVFGSAVCRDLWCRLVATDRELRIQAATYEAALELRIADRFAPGELVIPFDFIEACQASDHEPVSFTATGEGVRATWTDRGVPWQRDAGKPAKRLPPFPGAADETATNEPGFRQALLDVAACTDTENSRYALGCIQLDGSLGQIAATDGRQLIAQSGFRFPWSEGVLVRPNKGLWGRELPQDAPVLVGRGRTWVSFAIGDWSIWLREAEGRFPKFDTIVRDPADAVSTLTIDPQDATFAAEAIEHLPAKAEADRPVVLDLNGEVLLRAQPTDGSPAAELLLARSRCTGEPVKLTANRAYVSRALKLGFPSVAFYGNESLALAFDATRRYLFMPLAGEVNPTPGQELVRISSLDVAQHEAGKRRAASAPGAVAVSPPAAPPVTPPTAPHATHPTVLPTPSIAKEPTVNHNHSPSPQAVTAKPESVIDQATALRTSLREALARTSDLVRALKREKRHSKLVESTLQSLKQLQAAG